MKHILKVVVILLLIYTTFIIIESMRLENDHESAPMIVLKTEEQKEGTELKTSYISLGFSLEKTTFDDVTLNESFILFDKFTIWTWVQ